MLERKVRPFLFFCDIKRSFSKSTLYWHSLLPLTLHRRTALRLECRGRFYNLCFSLLEKHSPAFLWAVTLTFPFACITWLSWGATVVMGNGKMVPDGEVLLKMYGTIAFVTMSSLGSGWIFSNQWGSGHDKKNFLAPFSLPLEDSYFIIFSFLPIETAGWENAQFQFINQGL